MLHLGALLFLLVVNWSFSHTFKIGRLAIFMTNDVQQTLNGIFQIVNGKTHFWEQPEFWISIVVGVAGLIFAVLAYIEAKRAKIEAKSAKHAATEAGKTVKIQTITIELTEVLQKLASLEPSIEFGDAWNLLTEIQRRLRRIISPFQKDSELSETITALKEALSAASKALNSVRNYDSAKEQMAPLAVYNAIQDNFAAISNLVADLLGLFEKKTINFGDDDATY